eukprot:jgi/Chrzof1/4905/Cz15g04010.t1
MILHRKEGIAGRQSASQTVLAVVVLMGLAVVQALQPVPEIFKQCVNYKTDSHRTTYGDFVSGTPTRLRLHQAWWSDKEQAAPLTVATGLTDTRLDQLAAQCASWKGPLSAAVYLVLSENSTNGLSPANQKQLDDVAAQIAVFHKKTEVLDGCQLDMILLYETVAEPMMQVLLPINTLRNYALIQARTRLVAMVDVDLLVSNTLFDWMTVPENYELLKSECAKKKVFVLPAFETAHQKNMAAAYRMAADAVSKDKSGLAEMVANREIHQFALYLFREGHNCTNYQKWFKTDKPYSAGWTIDYEPWFIVDRFLNPFYDSVFRGYGWNKVTHVTNVHHQGFEFMVHPAGFLVHRQHGRSSADKMYQAQKKSYEAQANQNPAQGEKNTSLAGLTHRFRNRVLNALSKGIYSPKIDAGLTQCVATLAWWKRDTKGQAYEDGYDT